MNSTENFPRGGKRIPSKEGAKRKHEDNLFKIDTQPKAKKSRKEKTIKKPDTLTGDSWQSALKLHGTLSYNKIQDGMIVLGCVRQITNLAVKLEFPGLTFGQATINCISDAFTDLVTENLKGSNAEEPSSLVKKMFDLGQLVPAKVLSVQSTDKGHEISASLNPKDINSEKGHNSFLKGSTIWAYVTSKSDHGYELSVGVKNCRVFLPYKNIDDSQEYSVGKPLFCVVHKSEQSNVATTLTVSAKNEHLEKLQLSEDSILQHLIPGTKVEFCVEEVLSHGLKGKFLNHCFGYIDESQIFSKVNLGKVNEASILPAYILYVEPITNVTYLTLRGLDLLPPPELEIGQVISSEVLSNFAKGLFLKLGQNATGFVTNKRLLNTLPKHAELDVVDAVKKKYPIGSKHSCRILDYNRMQQLYICTFEQNLIKEKIFTVKDIKLGESVNVKVEKVIPSGIIVSAGHLQGFVPNLHLSNSKFSESVKGKYAVGKTFSARVLSITEEHNIIFTLKQGLVASDSCLVNVEDASVNSQYVGFIVQTKISGALVAFYGNAKGWISNRELNSGTPGKYSDPRDYFFRGQVVNVWIVGFKNDKLQVTVNPPDGTNKKKLKLGTKLKGIVTGIKSTGLDMEVGKRKISAVLPVAHLSDNLHMCPILLRTFKVGDEINHLICIKNKDIPVVSKREFLPYKKNKFIIPRLSKLKKGRILRCSFEKDSDAGIYVTTPIIDFSDNILIENKNLFAKGESCPVFQKNQNVLAKILKVDVENKTIILGARHNHIPHRTLHSSIEMLAETLEELTSVIEFGRANNWKLLEYNIGQRVQCNIKEKLNNGRLLVSLPNGVIGSVVPELYSSHIEEGTTVEGVVIDYNFVDERVEICLKNDIKQNINKKQDGIIKKSLQSSCLAQKLLTTKLYVLAVLKDGACNRQLIYLPLYYADKKKEEIHISFTETKLKVVAHRKVANKIIGIPKKLAVILKTESEDVKERLKAKKLISAEKTDKAEKNVESDEGCEMEVDDLEVEDNENIVLTSADEEMDESSEEEEKHDDDDDDDDDDEVQEEEMEDKEAHQGNQSASLSRNTESAPLLSGIKSFYSSDDMDNAKEEESSSDEDEQSQETAKKKKKLTPAERADLAKKEEERIAKIERELADSTLTPQSAEQFDRLLLANPNSSELWLKYIAMHVSATELDKARTVANRALETIKMALVKEKFNIWIALLNLENMYGTKESFDTVFEEAVKYNDSLEIYLSVIQILATSGKLVEMEEKIKKIRFKEKQNTKMWLECSKVYYSLGKFKEARNLKEAALKSILDHRRQFDLIVKFGIMEFQSGELEQAIANFETIINTYPSKINIWIIYVDQLVKKKKIEEARKVLERAVNQKFSLKNMKAIFQKFITFEEQHGSADMIEEIKRKAKEYVKSAAVAQERMNGDSTLRLLLIFEDCGRRVSKV